MKCEKCGAPVRPMPPDGDVRFNEAQVRNTRPHPAPPEGEPDFNGISREAANACGFDANDRALIRWGEILAERGYEIGLAARPKVEDAEVASKMTNNFSIYIRKMENLATECADEDRRLDAVQTLAILCLILCDGWRPDPNGGEVIDLSVWRKVA